MIINEFFNKKQKVYHQIIMTYSQYLKDEDKNIFLTFFYKPKHILLQLEEELLAYFRHKV